MPWRCVTLKSDAANSRLGLTACKVTDVAESITQGAGLGASRGLMASLPSSAGSTTTTTVQVTAASTAAREPPLPAEPRRIRMAIATAGEGPDGCDVSLQGLHPSTVHFGHPGASGRLVT